MTKVSNVYHVAPYVVFITFCCTKSYPHICIVLYSILLIKLYEYYSYGESGKSCGSSNGTFRHMSNISAGSKHSVIPCCARSRGDTNRSEHHTAFSEMKRMTRKCAVSCQVVVRQFTDWNILLLRIWSDQPPQAVSDRLRLALRLW